MLEAKKNRLVEFLLAGVNRRMIRRQFWSHRLRGTAVEARLDRTLPAIFYANHSSWWDGFIAFHLTYDLWKLDGILMMEEDELRKYPFFRWIGAFGIRRTGAEVEAMIRYAAGELREKGRILWMFPQGALFPNGFRPVELRPGIAHVARAVGRVQIVPVVHRYEYLKEERAEIFTSVGPIRTVGPEEQANPEELTRQLQNQLSGDLDRLQADIHQNRLEEFKTTLRGRISTNVRYDRARGIS
jgi:1-acyl-sn-glycerol-3-phosphate acyltransferase